MEKLTKEQQDIAVKYMNMAKKIANKFYLIYKDKYSYEDLQDEAYITLCKCIPKYNPERSTLNTFIYNSITWGLKYFIRTDKYYPSGSREERNKQAVSNVISIQGMNESRSPFDGCTEFERAIMIDHDNPDPLTDISFDEILSNLTEKQKNVLALHYKYNLKHSEIAQSWNVTRHRIYQIEKRAIATLKRKMCV